MTILDTFFTNPPKLERFYPRKLQLPKDESFLLCGARGCGKSALVIDYINSLQEQFLYIDCEDPAFILKTLDEFELEEFIKEEGIKVLILDHYFEGFLEYLPKAEQLIAVSRLPLDLGLKRLRLYPLDFEEFINFKNRNEAIDAFNLYAKFGSLAHIAKSSNTLLASRELFFEKFDSQEGKVLLILSFFQGKVATSHQIYQRAKEDFKISKDWLYKTIKNYEKEGVLYKIKTLEGGFGEKIFLYDFIFSKYLNKNQLFITTFDTLVALALLKKGVKILASNSPLGYLNGNRFIQVAPFEDEANLWKKAQNSFGFYTKHKIKKVIAVTVNGRYNFKIKDIKFEAVPFYEWTIGE